MWVYFCALYSIDLSVCFLCQCHTVWITEALQYSLKPGSMIPPALFFPLKTVLAIRGFLCFHTNFRFIYSSSVKNAIGILIGIALKDTQKKTFVPVSLMNVDAKSPTKY